MSSKILPLQKYKEKINSEKERINTYRGLFHGVSPFWDFSVEFISQINVQRLSFRCLEMISERAISIVEIRFLFNSFKNFYEKNFYEIF